MLAVAAEVAVAGVDEPELMAVRAPPGVEAPLLLPLLELGRRPSSPPLPPFDEVLLCCRSIATAHELLLLLLPVDASAPAEKSIERRRLAKRGWSASQRLGNETSGRGRVREGGVVGGAVCVQNSNTCC